MDPNLLIVGIGNRMRGDDAIGIMVADRVAQKLGASARVSLDAYELWNVLHTGVGQGFLALVDAAQASAEFKLGAWRRFEFPNDTSRIASAALRGTHSIDVVSILKLGQTLSAMPKQIRIYAVAASQFGFAEQLSPKLGSRLPVIVSQIKNDMRLWLEADSCMNSRSHARFVESH